MQLVVDQLPGEIRPVGDRSRDDGGINRAAAHELNGLLVLAQVIGIHDAAR